LPLIFTAFNVGDSRESLIATYGNPTSVEQQGNVDIFYYQDEAKSAELELTIASDKVTEIKLLRIVKRNNLRACWS
jgi:hypothetical protein